MSLTVGSILAVGFLLGDRDGRATRPVRAPLACGLGGALCVLVVAAEASRRSLCFEPAVAASAVVLPVAYGLLGAAEAVGRRIAAGIVTRSRISVF